MSFFKQIILIIIGIICGFSSLSAYYDSKTIDNKEIVIINNEDLFDKNFNVNTMLFSAIASERVYDNDFYEKNSANYFLYKENGFQQITSYIANDLLNDLEVSIAKKYYKNKLLIVISFRGTNFGEYDGITDIITDLNALPISSFSPWDSSIKVHKGFFQSEQLFEKAIQNKVVQFIKTDTEQSTTLLKILEDANRTKSSSKNIQFLITGHSLGGAIATLFAARLIDYYNVDPENIVVYTFGAPAVGNKHFKYVFEDNKNKYKVFKYFYRIRNLYDPVPYLTSEKFVAMMKYSLASVSAILEKPEWVIKILNLKASYYHIGKQYVFDPENSLLIYGNELNNQKYRMTYKKAINNLAIFWHKLKYVYIPNIKTYNLYKNIYFKYCNNNYKNLDFDFIKDAMLGDLVKDKNKMTNNILAYKNFNNKINFFRIQIGNYNYCYTKILNRYYFYNNPKIYFVDKNIPFANLWYERLFKDYYFNKKSKKIYAKLFDFLNDEKFMKVIDKLNIGIAGPMKKDNIISLFNELKKEYSNINIPTIFKEKNEKDIDFYNQKIFLSDPIYQNKIYKQYISKEEALVLLAYFKAANSKYKWIINKKSPGYKFLISKNINPYYYYLFKRKIKNNPNINIIKGYDKLFFLRRLYKLLKGFTNETK